MLILVHLLVLEFLLLLVHLVFIPALIFQLLKVLIFTLFVIYKSISLDGLLAGGYTISAKINDFLKVSYCHVHPDYMPSIGSSFKKGSLITKVGPKNVYGIHNNPYKDSNGNPTNGAMTGCHLHLTLKENYKAVDPLKYLKKQ